MSCDNKTVVFNEKVKGWSSFMSFNPDMMVGLNNKFYSFKDGNLWEHHSDNVDRNNFYDVQYTSKIDTVLNDNPSDVKVFKALAIEGNESWTSIIKSYISDEEDYTSYTVPAVDFVKKEGVWYAGIRGNQEDNGEITGGASYGIGTPTLLDTLTITVDTSNSRLDIGDTIYRDDLLPVGIITAVGDGVITVDSIANTPLGFFLIGKKNLHIEGGASRGYVAKVEMENDSLNRVELFSVEANIFKSFS